MSVDEQRMSQNFQDNSLTISGTIVRDSGVYTCIISNGLDEARAYAFLTVKGNTGLQIRKVTENYFSYFSTKTYVVGTQKNRLNEFF